MAAAGNRESYLIDGLYGIRDLVDIDRLEKVFKKFTDITGFNVELQSYPEMDTLTSTGWQPVCRKFYMASPEAAVSCLRGNSSLLKYDGGNVTALTKECSYGLADCGIPIVVEGKHIASLFTGQVFLKEPDREKFRKQAEEFGFDWPSYLEAVKEVPVVTGVSLLKAADFLSEISLMISEQGLIKLQKSRRTAEIEREVAQRKAAEECLWQSEEKYRFLAEKMGDIVWTVDMDLNTTFVTPSVERVLGFTPDEYSRQTLEQKMVPESLEKIRKVFAEEVKRNMEHPDEIYRSVVMEAEYIHRDGSTVWLENTMKAIRDHSGKIVGVYGLSRDISQRRKNEKERKKLQDQLIVAQKMESLGRLAGGIAHDFNNLLTVIIGHTELALQTLETSDNLQNTLHQIHRAAEDSAALTGQLLAFARKQVIQPKVLNINETVSGMLVMLHRLIGEQIELRWIPADDLWLSMVDPGQIDQIVVNLCVNARDAIDGVGTISIETKNARINEEFCAAHQGITPGEWVSLSVTDSGSGIDKDVLKHIFEPFFTTKGVGKGTGLGLATVYGIVKQNGGYVDVQSEQNKGAKVTVYLPGFIAGVVERMHNVVDEIPRGHGETVLLVEDERAVLEMTKSMLEGLGYNTIAAGLPEEALEIVRLHKEEIHLLLTDMVMPEMNGKELVEKVIRLKPAIKYLFMSGYTAEVTLTLDTAEKGQRFIQKPFSIRTIAVRINRILKES